MYFNFIKRYTIEIYVDLHTVGKPNPFSPINTNWTKTGHQTVVVLVKLITCDYKNTPINRIVLFTPVNVIDAFTTMAQLQCIWID